MKIDLRNLTQDKVDEALPHVGSCSYEAPCIIGTLLPPEKRFVFDAVGGGMSIRSLELDGFVEFLDEQQRELACELQQAFDNHGKDPRYNFPDALAKISNTLNLGLKPLTSADLPEHVE